MPIRFVPYQPTPVQGQAVLNNFFRNCPLLRYEGYDKLETRLRRGMPLHETTLLEQVGTPTAAPNLLLRGECLTACAYLKDQGIEIDLVYIDPPFASGADYAKQVYLRRNPKLAEKLKAAEEQLEDDELRAFEEKMYGDIWRKEDYLNWMYENLMAIKSVMSDTASIYVHLDAAIGHYVKVMLDEVFGEENFQREIIWDISVLSGFKTIAPNWIRGHDTIFYYSKSSDRVFNKLMQPHTEKYAAMFDREETQADGSVRKYLVAHGLKRYWDEVEAKGKPFGDVWGDIMSFQQQPTSDEKVGYSTQKPESLLERIISASSNQLRPDGTPMLVADFFGGSGVTAAVAHRLGRRFVHVDVGINSLQTTRDRLKAQGAAFAIRDIQDGVALFRNPQQTADKLKQVIPGLRNEDGLPTFWEGAIFSTQHGGPVPVYLPNLLDHNARVLDVPLLNRIMDEAAQLPDDAYQHVIVYYVDLSDKAELEDFLRTHNPTTRTFELRPLAEILDDLRLNDEVSATVVPPAAKGAPWQVRLDAFHSDRLSQRIAEFNHKRGAVKPEDADALEEGPDTETDEATPKAAKKFKPLTVSDEGLELIEWLSVDATSAADPAAPWHSDAEILIDKKGFVRLNGQKTGQFWDGTIQSAQRPLRLKVRNIAGDETVVVL